MRRGRWLGVDFSGDMNQWGAGRKKSNIWVAEVRGEAHQLALIDLRRVQDLPGEKPPFERLASLLRGPFGAAGIDAPFSVPADFVRHYHTLLKLAVGAKPPGRPFASGRDLVFAVTGRQPPLLPPKPLRATEKEWAEKGVNVRSALWAGARGGAPMTAACLTLLDLVGGPVWPLMRAGTSLLVEAFPAAQLRVWGLPHQGYGDAVEGDAARKVILDHLKTRLHVGEFERHVLQSADALDAVLCTFAAMAVTEGRLAVEPPPDSGLEGWIAVHR